MMGNFEMKPWIGVDLDGTLAEYEGDTATIGPPVAPMMEKVKQILEQGIYDVRIFTARASVPSMIPEIEEWLSQNGLPKLAITNQKDFQMIACYDDRAITVIPNTGLTVFEQYGIET